MTPRRTALAARPPAICGPTASGKSALALAVAELLGSVELVSVDSMQVYRGMDIGTAKPTVEERAAVPHHMLDLVDPSEEFTVGEFKARAAAALADIRARGQIPVLVGGSGLYLRALIDDLDIPGRFGDVLAELDAEPDTAALHARLARLDPVAAGRMEPSNRRRVLRALEVTVGSGRRFSEYGPGLGVYPNTAFVQVALRLSRAELDRRIARRYERQIADGFVDEVRRLHCAGMSATSAAALGYRELMAHVRGEISLDAALEAAIRRTCRFARRQQRWLARDPRIRWIDAPADPAQVVAEWENAIADTREPRAARPATMGTAMAVRLSKHHGLGNDFLVALMPQLPLDAADLARRWCDRRTGIGADGLIFGLIGDHRLAMRVFNRDGSEAELSGNGLRCLAQSVARLREATTLEVDVDTPAGVRHCSVTRTEVADTVVVTVDMGDVGPGPDPDVGDPIAAAGEPATAVKRWRTGSVGNPHLVCEVDDPDAIDLELAGAALESHFPKGANVHFVTLSGPDELTARVWERGVGVTNACGSAAVVMAACFHEWGLVGDRVVVRMPGGEALVDLAGPVTLTGPATHVADLEVADG